MRTDRGLSEKIIKLALQNGAQHAEVFQRASRMLSAEVKSGEITAVESAVGFGYGVRVIKDGRLGFSYSTEKEDALKTVSAAIDMAAYTEQDDAHVLPGPAKAENTEVFDPEVASVGEREAVQMALSLERAAFGEDKRVKRTRKAMTSFSSGETLVSNSLGIDFSYPTTSVSAHLMAIAEEGGDSQMGWGYGAGRFLSDVGFEQVGAEAAQRATRLLGAVRITPSKSALVLDSYVATEFLSVLSSMLSSENVQKGKSLLSGRVGERVVSENMNIIDDGLLRHGTGTRPVDDEGVPASRKVLVEEGALKGFMHNCRTAQKDNVPSTGNAVRGRFNAMPSVGPTNLYIEPSGSSISREEIFASADTGLFIIETMGMHTANPISGDFSVGVSGLWVEGGKPSHPVKEAVVSGNILDFFGRVVHVGDDLRFYGSAGSPSLLIGPTDISA